MNFSIAAVVVLVPSHLRFLSDLVKNLNSAKPAFQRVLIIASGFSSRRKVINIASKCTAPRVSVFFSVLGSAGRNRNCAWNLVEEDIICFLDGDDLYASTRNAVIHSVFKSSRCDLFLHGFTDFHDAAKAPETDREIGPIRPGDLVLSDQLAVQPNRDRKKELAGKTPSTNLVFRDPAREFPVHHAHIVVRASIGKSVQFHEVFGVRNEDGVFAQDVIEAGGLVALSPEKLSFYRQGARAKPKPIGEGLLLRMSRVRESREELVIIRGE